MKWLRYAAVVALLAATSAEAQGPTTGAFLSGNRLYEYCKDENANCVGYVAGVADMLSDLSGQGVVRGVCFQNGVVTVEQAILAFQNYAREHPASLSFVAANVVWNGLIEAFPCK